MKNKVELEATKSSSAIEAGTGSVAIEAGPNIPLASLGRGSTPPDEDDVTDRELNEEVRKVQEELKDSGFQPVTLAQIRGSYGEEKEGWRTALEAELGSFKHHTVFRVAIPQENAAINARKGGWQLLPCKVVAGLKPPSATGARRKKGPNCCLW